MQQTALTIQKDVWDFCAFYLKRFGRDKILDSELIAAQVREFCGIKGRPSLIELITALKQSLGISDVKPFTPAGNERGQFIKYVNRIEIFYKRDDWYGSQDFTFAHELREVLGAVFTEIDPVFQDATGDELERQSEAFAAALLMPHEEFLKAMFECGLDPICLHHEFQKAYEPITIRMAQVIRNHELRIHLWISIFERDRSEPKCVFRSLRLNRSTPYNPRTRFRVPNLFFPKNGQIVKLSGSLETAHKMKRPVFVKKVTGLDFWDIYTLSMLIRPVIWGGEVEKIIVVALPEEQNQHLKPQLISCNPILIKDSFQMF